MNRHECLLIVRNVLYENENSVYVTYISQLLNPLKKKHLSSYKPEDTTFCTLCLVRLYLSYIIGKTFTEYSEVKRTFHSINVYKALATMSSPFKQVSLWSSV